MNRILIVDDEAIGRAVMEDIFGRYGQTVSVSTGHDAIRLYKKATEVRKDFNLVFLDISLEDMNGLDLLNQIKDFDAAQEKKGAMVIMVTAHSERELVMGCIQSGCRAYFIKPLKQKTVDKKMSELGFRPLK